MPPPVLPPISLKAEPLFTIGPLQFTNSMLFTLIIIVALTLFYWLATRRMRLVPRGIQNVGEALVEFLLGTVEGTAGKRVGRRIFPLIATLFIFIIVANWSALLPGVGTIGICEKEANPAAQHAIVAKTAAPPQQETKPAGGVPGAEVYCPAGTAFVPFLRAANADLNTTLAMALLAVLVVQIAGFAAHGVKGYLKELATPWPLTPIHIISELSRIISLSFRLFGNVFGGEVLVTVMFVLLGTIFLGFGTFIFMGLELLFGFIQATIFSTLTLVYIAVAVGGGHEAEGHAEPGSLEAAGEQLGAKLAGQRIPGVSDGPGSSTATHVGG